MTTLDEQDNARTAALKAAKEMVRQLRIAYPHRVPDSIKRTCNEYVKHVLAND
mgnify:CR=1 FL=1|jgi:hypothetical protein